MLTLTLPSPNGTFCTMSLQRYKSFVKSRVPFAYRSYLWIRDVFPSRVFDNIYHNNGWTSVSGRGSTLDETENIRRDVPTLIANFEIKTILDIPCGNHAWMSRVNLGGCKYLGADIVRDLISQNRRQYAGGRQEFVVLDLTNDHLTTVELIICRDCLVHLSFRLIAKALRNIKLSGSKYLLTTTFPSRDRNEDIKTGGWRTLNLRASPFNFPEPILLINEGCKEAGGAYGDKSLGLWRIDEIPDPGWHLHGQETLPNENQANSLKKE
jgi:SAM-dependent methyltransferase